MCAKNPIPGGSTWRGKATRAPWATARASAASSDGDASKYTNVPTPDASGTAETGMVRFSPGHLTTDDDIDAAIEGVRAIHEAS